MFDYVTCQASVSWLALYFLVALAFGVIVYVGSES